MKYKIAGKIIVISVLPVLVFNALGGKPAQAQADMDILIEDFNSPLSGWKTLGSAKLENGWLQLTPNEGFKAGVAY